MIMSVVCSHINLFNVLVLFFKFIYEHHSFLLDEYGLIN